MHTRHSQVRRPVLAPAFCFDNRRTRHGLKDAPGFALVATDGRGAHTRVATKQIGKAGRTLSRRFTGRSIIPHIAPQVNCAGEGHDRGKAIMPRIGGPIQLDPTVRVLPNHTPLSSASVSLSLFSCSSVSDVLRTLALKGCNLSSTFSASCASPSRNKAEVSGRRYPLSSSMK